MTVIVNITKGFYRGKVISGSFELVQPYKSSARGGGFITIKNPEPTHGTPPIQRVTVEENDYSVADGEGVQLGAHQNTEKVNGTLAITHNFENAFIKSESEDDAMIRIADTFAMLDRITDACARGVIRGLVVSGPPGVGKSFGVEKQLNTANLFLTIAGKEPQYEIVSGGVSSIGLYQKLYHNRQPGQVLVFDDSDGVLFEEECLCLLKAALNSGDRRRICWNKESRVLATEDIPEHFDFEGSIIFLTNIDFEKSIAKGSKISAHLSAIMSRCHYLDLEIGTMRDKLLRIKQIIKDGMLNSYQFTPSEEVAIIDYVISNSEYMRDVSLRAVKKIADLVKSDPSDWRNLVESTMLTKEAKFRRLYERKISSIGLVAA
jgi:hypothetical protein